MLVDVTPYTARGEAGLVFIMDSSHLQAWLQANLVGLVADGYVRVAVVEHLTHNQRMIVRMGGKA